MLVLILLCIVSMIVLLSIYVAFKMHETNEWIDAYEEMQKREDDGWI